MVYQVIEKAGNKGIWQKDIRSATGLQQNVGVAGDTGWGTVLRRVTGSSCSYGWVAAKP